MTRPLRIVFPGAKYHITSRGNGRQRIFHGLSDYERFLEQLDAALEADEVLLYAYVLMPNHYHLFIETPLGNVKRFMQRLNTAYSMYYRYKHNRPGHCFQGRYGARLVEGEAYILGLTRYIHLNPIKVRRMVGKTGAEKETYLEKFKWSSYGGYVNKGLTEERVLYSCLGLMDRRSRQANRRAYRKFVQEMIEGEDNNLLTAMNASRYVIGDEGEREQAEQMARTFEMSSHHRDVEWPEPDLVEMSVIEKMVSSEFKVSVGDIHFHGRRARVAKSITIELCCQLSGKTQREIAVYLGYSSESSIGKQRQRLRDTLGKDKKLQLRMNRMKRRLLDV